MPYLVGSGKVKFSASEYADGAFGVQSERSLIFPMALPSTRIGVFSFCEIDDDFLGRIAGRARDYQKVHKVGLELTAKQKDDRVFSNTELLKAPQ